MAFITGVATPSLAASSVEDYDLLPPRFERVWLHPAIAALERRMHVAIPEDG